MLDHLPNNDKRIVIKKNGPIVVKGSIPLVHKTQVVSEYGEPLTWKKDQTYDSPGETYCLCRCGQSSNKPFCDGSHRRVEFDGTETADTGETAERQRTLRGGVGIVVKKDFSLCMDSGFCGLRNASMNKLTAATEEPQVRSLVMAMIERCPSGSLVYKIEPNGPDIEPDLPQQIANTTEITSGGPIQGPLWVMGGIPIERSDGQPFETRNRVTLCTCGHSKNKPLCDGTHRREAEKKMQE